MNLDLVAPQNPGFPAGGGVSALMQGMSASRIRNLMMNIFQKAKRANVNVYTMDACGLRAPAMQSFPPPTCVPGIEPDYLRTIAEGTGGRAFVDTNDFGPAVAALFRENASYYLLGYRPASGNDGRLHRLEVRVNRPGVEVRTRNGYQALKPADEKSAPPRSPPRRSAPHSPGSCPRAISRCRCQPSRSRRRDGRNQPSR